MKRLTIFAFFGVGLLGLSFNLFAALPVKVKKVEQMGDFMPPRMYDLVTTQFVIEVKKDCAHKILQRFTVEVHAPASSDALYEVEFLDQTKHECDFPKKWAEYHLSTIDLPLFTRRIAIVNPVIGATVDVRDKTTH